MKPLIVTSAPLLTSIMLGIPSTCGSNSVGALIMVDWAPVPTSVTLLLIVSCSVYIPGSTFIVSPGLAASIADCIVGYSLGTVIRGAALDTYRSILVGRSMNTNTVLTMAIAMDLFILIHLLKSNNKWFVDFCRLQSTCILLSSKDSRKVIIIIYYKFYV